MTWQARPACGCDAAVRPRGRAAHGPCEAQVARTHGRRPCGSTRTPMRGAMWQSGDWHLEGPRVSEPCLGDLGGNANALPRPIFYTYLLSIFPPCGTKVLVEFNRSKTRGNIESIGCNRNTCRGVDRVDPSPHNHNRSTCVK